MCHFDPLVCVIFFQRDIQINTSSHHSTFLIINSKHSLYSSMSLFLIWKVPVMSFLLSLKDFHYISLHWLFSLFLLFCFWQVYKAFTFLHKSFSENLKSLIFWKKKRLCVSYMMYFILPKFILLRANYTLKLTCDTPSTDTNKEYAFKWMKYFNRKYHIVDSQINEWCQRFRFSNSNYQTFHHLNNKITILCHINI